MKEDNIVANDFTRLRLLSTGIALLVFVGLASGVVCYFQGSTPGVLDMGLFAALVVLSIVVTGFFVRARGRIRPAYTKGIEGEESLRLQGEAYFHSRWFRDGSGWLLLTDKRLVFKSAPVALTPNAKDWDTPLTQIREIRIKKSPGLSPASEVELTKANGDVVSLNIFRAERWIAGIEEAVAAAGRS